MRLLLDEMYVGEIAVRLREHGHDVLSVHDRPELVGAPDAELFRLAIREERAVVTENVQDFAPLVRQAALAGEAIPGVVYSSPRRLPRSSSTVGIFVDALDRLLRARPESTLAEQVVWLQP